MKTIVEIKVIRGDKTISNQVDFEWLREWDSPGEKMWAIAERLAKNVSN